MEINRCVHCMTEITPGAKFCKHCGKPTSAGADEPGYCLKPMTILHGRYLVGGMLSQTGNGVTYIGYDLSRDAKVAIREYFPMDRATRVNTASNRVTWSGSRPDRDGFLREAPNTARDAFEDNDTAYIVTDYVEGGAANEPPRETRTNAAEEPGRQPERPERRDYNAYNGYNGAATAQPANAHPTTAQPVTRPANAQPVTANGADSAKGGGKNRKRVTIIAVFAGAVVLALLLFLLLPGKKDTNEITLGDKTFTTDVTTLDLSNQGITDISELAKCTELQVLDISYNNITDITPLKNLTNLTILDISNNNVKDITPLANLTNLECLMISSNAIKDITPLANLTNLTKLYMTGTPVTDVTPLQGLTSLTELTIALSSLTQEQIDDLAWYLPNCTIYYSKAP